LRMSHALKLIGYREVFLHQTRRRRRSDGTHLYRQLEG
jgi:hypothetical protein